MSGRSLTYKRRDMSQLPQEILLEAQLLQFMDLIPRLPVNNATREKLYDALFMALGEMRAKAWNKEKEKQAEG